MADAHDPSPADWVRDATPGVASSTRSGEGTPSSQDDEAREDFDEPRSWRSGDAAPVPLRRLLFRPSVPDLSRIQADSWYEVLLPLSDKARVDAALCPGLSHEQRRAAYELTGRMPPPPSAAARAAVEVAPTVPVPTPPAASDARRPGLRQVNVRLSARDHEDLRTAAHLLGAKPAQLARMLVLNGVRRALSEHDAAIARAATSP